MVEEADWHERWMATHDQMGRFVRARDFESAIQLLTEARESAVAADSREEAASYSNLLSSCLVMAHRDSEALQASLRSERLWPNEFHYKVRSADLLVNYLGQPGAALEKLQELNLSKISSTDATYHARSIFGQANLALGNIDAAIAAFREVTSPRVMRELSGAGYHGVYDLGLVKALIDHGLILGECREYLITVRIAAEKDGNLSAVEGLHELIARTWRPPNSA